MSEPRHCDAYRVVKLDPATKAYVDQLVADRLLRDRKARARHLEALVLERDRLAVEVANLRRKLEERET
jgi:hypothetical protein